MSDQTVEQAEMLDIMAKMTMFNGDNRFARALKAGAAALRAPDRMGRMEAQAMTIEQASYQESLDLAQDVWANGRNADLTFYVNRLIAAVEVKARAATLREVEQEAEHRAATVRGFGITDYDQGRQDALNELSDWCAARREGR